MSLRNRFRRWAQHRGIFPGYPSEIVIDNNRACNARCVMCPTQKNRPDQVMMRDETFERLARQIGALAGTLEQLQIGVHGEPFLDKKLEERVARLSKAGLKHIQINTNGSLMSPKRRARLLEVFTGSRCRLTVCVSMESHIPEVFEKIRVGLDFEGVRRATEQFIAERNAAGANVAFLIRFVEQEPNAGTFDDYRASWTPLLTPELDGFDFQPMHNWATAQEGTSDYGRSPCHLLRGLTVSHDGSVPLCCVDYDRTYDLGNLNEQPLLDIYRSQQYRELQRRHLAGERDQLELCATCSVPEQASRTRV